MSDTNLFNTLQYDESCKLIPQLKWFPWVGGCFPERPANKKLLIIGESHYANDAASKEASEKDCWHTRQIFQQGFAQPTWHATTLGRIPQLLFRTSRINKTKFCNNISYYNFVQRSMANKHDRPTRQDFETGWKVFGEVIKTMRPSHCLFIGVTASNTFNSLLSQTEWTGNIAVTVKIGRVRARHANIECKGIHTELVFVKHLSKFPRYAEWHDYLVKQCPELMSWLVAEEYAIDQASR